MEILTHDKLKIVVKRTPELLLLNVTLSLKHRCIIFYIDIVYILGVIYILPGYSCAST